MTFLETNEKDFDSFVFWNQAFLDAANAARVGGPPVDVVRDFIGERVPEFFETLE